MKKPQLHIVLLFSVHCSPPREGSAQNAKHYTLKVEESLPHDVGAYTQGLFFTKESFMSLADSMVNPHSVKWNLPPEKCSKD